MEYKCEKCGHVNDFVPSVRINELLNWQQDLSLELGKKISNTFKQLRGYFTDTNTGKIINYRTLFLTDVVRKTLFDEFSEEEASKEPEIKERFTDKFVPVLSKIDKHFNILGSLTKPSVLKLAGIDLSSPYAVFCFVTVEDSLEVTDKLKEIGLESLEIEGSLNTILLCKV